MQCIVCSSPDLRKAQRVNGYQLHRCRRCTHLFVRDSISSEVRQLKPGGWLAVNTVDLESWGPGSQHRGGGTSVTRAPSVYLTHRLFRSLLEDRGFQIKCRGGNGVLRNRKRAYPPELFDSLARQGRERPTGSKVSCGTTEGAADRGGCDHSMTLRKAKINHAANTCSGPCAASLLDSREHSPGRHASW